MLIYRPAFSANNFRKPHNRYRLSYILDCCRQGPIVPHGKRESSARRDDRCWQGQGRLSGDEGAAR
jgi:hypothetical protein